LRSGLEQHKLAKKDLAITKSSSAPSVDTASMDMHIYDAEYCSAIKAVRLASKLCQVNTASMKVLAYPGALETASVHT
jgi:hypothetical protein